MIPPRNNAAFTRRLAGPLGAALLAALFPKCVACLVAYAAVASGLGVAGPEICGGAASGSGVSPWVGALAAGLAGGALQVWRRRSQRCAADARTDDQPRVGADAPAEMTG